MFLISETKPRVQSCTHRALLESLLADLRGPHVYGPDHMTRVELAEGARVDDQHLGGVVVSLQD